MEIHTNIPLKNYTTMRLGGPARFMTDIHSLQELQTAYTNALSKHIPIFVLGGGSNLLAHDEGYDGLILRIRIPGFAVIAEDETSTTLKLGAGENWDSVVKRTVAMRLYGIEAMSAIPGTVGAAPVQNVGAYGQEIADTLQSVEALDTTTGQVVSLQNADCGFSYRHSIFRGDQQGRYIITSVTVKLWKGTPQPPFYDSLQDYFDSHQIAFYTQDTVRDAVIAIRAEKLPDPSVMANAGSFFKNAIVEDWQMNDLRQQYPDMKSYVMPDGRYKLPTGWLIEKAGLKGQLLNGIRVYDKNALVLVNESATGYADLAAARDTIISAVHDNFRVMIEQEPLEIS